MENFFILEGGLLTVSAFLLAVIAFTTTRSFVRKGMFKKSLLNINVVKQNINSIFFIMQPFLLLLYNQYLYSVF